MKKLLIFVILSTPLSGCGGSVQSPIATSNEASRMSLGILCNRYVNFPPTNNFHVHAKNELDRRGISASECFAIAKK